MPPRPPVPPIPCETNLFPQPALAREEQRVDLEDGRAKTLNDFRAEWAEWYSIAEIDDYWVKRCRPLSTFRGAGGSKPPLQQHLAKAVSQPKTRHNMLDPTLAWGVPGGNVEDQVEPGPLVREAKCGYQWQDGRGRWHMFGASAAAVISEALCQGEPSARVSLDTGRRYFVSLSPLQQRSAPADSPDAALVSNVLVTDAPVANVLTTDVPVANAPLVSDSCPAISSLAPTSGTGADRRQTRLTLKVGLGRETRRLAVAWPGDMCPKDVLAVMLASVADGFGPSLAPAGFTLHYIDDDGDLCTLVERTLHDCLSFARGGVLRLQVRTSTASDASPSEAALPDANSMVGAPDFAPGKPASPPVMSQVSIHDEYDRDWALVDAGGGASEVEFDS